MECELKNLCHFWLEALITMCDSPRPPVLGQQPWKGVTKWCLYQPVPLRDKEEQMTPSGIFKPLELGGCRHNKILAYPDQYTILLLVLFIYLFVCLF